MATWSARKHPRGKDGRFAPRGVGSISVRARVKHPAGVSLVAARTVPLGYSNYEAYGSAAIGVQRRTKPMVQTRAEEAVKRAAIKGAIKGIQAEDRAEQAVRSGYRKARASMAGRRMKK